MHQTAIYWSKNYLLGTIRYRSTRRILCPCTPFKRIIYDIVPYVSPDLWV